MDLLRLPWIQHGGGQGGGGERGGGGGGGRAQFPLDHLFRRDDRAAGGGGDRDRAFAAAAGHHGVGIGVGPPMDGGGGGGGDHNIHLHHHHQQQPQGKDFKMMSPLQKVLDELNMSILPHDIRLNAIVEAAEHFDHRDKARHDYELHEGAARIIYQKLAFVLTLQLSNYNAGSSYNVVTSGLNAMGTSSSSTTSSFNTRSYDHHHHGNTSDPISIQKIRSTRSQEASDADYEIALLTTCLEMVHRASPNAIANTWFSIGEESLPILIKLLERPFCKIQSILEKAEKQHQSANTIEKLIATIATNKETKVAVQKVTKILAVYSLIPAAKLKMAKCPGFLSILVKITDTHNMNRMKSLRPVSKRLMANKTNIHNQNHQSDSNYYHNNSGNNTSGNNNNNSNLAASDDDRSIISQSTKLLNPIAPSTVEQPTNNTIPGISNTNNANANTNINSSQISSGSNGIRGTTAGVGLYMTEASRFNSIAILTNLAAVEKNRLIMLSEPGLVNNIARVVHNERSDVARQCSALAIMNLSNGDREHVPELAGNDLLLEAIVKLTRDDLLETRRNAVIALFNVACADENTVKLVRYKDGVILDVLMQIVGSSNVSDVEDEMNEDVRTTAAEALFNISCSSIVETTDRFANHPNLLETCALVLKSHFLSREVKVYCAAILRRMAEIINFPKKSQLELLSALVKASSWTRTGCIASAFLSQAGVVENRKVMVEHHGLLTALSKLALVSGDGECDRIRSDAISTIEHLSREAGRVRETLSKHEGIMLAMTRASYNRRPSSSSSMYGMEEESSTETSRSTQLALKRLVEII